jgi:hypothetical protein
MKTTGPSHESPNDKRHTFGCGRAWRGARQGGREAGREAGRQGGRLTECSHLPVPPSDDDDRIRPKLKGDVLPRLTDLGIMPGKDPFLVPNRIDVDLVEVWIVIRATS